MIRLVINTNIPYIIAQSVINTQFMQIDRYNIFKAIVARCRWGLLSCLNSELYQVIT